MRTIRGLENLELFKKKSVVTIGVFDGVHKGHQKIIRTVVKEAKKREAYSVVMTFEPHPREVLKPGAHLATLTSTDLKAQLIEKLGADFLVIVPFTKKFCLLTPEQFIKQLLLERLNACCVVVGENFRFGKGAQGDVRQLTSYGNKYNFDVVSVAPVKIKDKLVSSTLAREALKRGDLKGVKEVLGRFPRITGKVVKGRGRGKRLGFPTANIETPDKASVPKIGVYAGFAYVYNKRRPCVIDIGTSPTFGDIREVIHVHIINFDESIYQERLEIEIVARIRDEEPFPDEVSLSRQIAQDIQIAQKVFKRKNL